MAFDKRFNMRVTKLAKKLYLIDMLGGECEHCGETRFYVMNFHHDSEELEKSFNVASSCDLRLSNLIQESKKCILLCANCHQKHHMNNMNNYDKRINTKNTLFEYMGTSACKCCGENDSRILTFHHTRDKIFGISNWITNKHIKSVDNLDIKIKDELDKCILLCHNCHLTEHHEHEFFENNKEIIIQKTRNIKENSKPLDKELVKQMYLSGMKQIEIARHFGTVKSTICDILKGFGFTKKLSDITYDRNKIKDLHNKGFTNKEISTELNIPKSSVSKILKNLNIKPNHKPITKELKLKLSKEELLNELRTLTIKEISIKYNVSYQCVYERVKSYKEK